MTVIASTTPRTLTDVLLPGQSHWLNLARIVAGSLFIALAAQVSIPLPFTPVPITGQTFAILLTGILLGGNRGALAVLLYLAEGAVGLPVFAGGASGLAKFVGPTGGYLFAFPFDAYLTGRLAEAGWDRKPATAGLAMFLGSLVVLTAGSLNLARFVPGGLSSGFTLGFLPFLPGDLVKTTLAALLLPGAWRLVGRAARR